MKDKIEIIHDWLGSPLYWRGVEIYNLYGESPFLKKLFSSTEDDYNREKLATALQEIADREVEQEEEVVTRMPEILRLKLDEGKTLMDERAALKERLRVYYHDNKPEALCKDVAFSILNINDKLNEIFDEERFYKSTGFLPERAVYEGDTIAELYKRRNNLRTYISRSKNERKLESFKKELFAIEKKIEVLVKTN
jgi:hypothetical protein